VVFGLVGFFNGELFCTVSFFCPSLVGFAKLTALAKLYCVDLKDTSFRKFNLNFFYKKWILNFEFDPNVWMRFKS